MYELSEEERIAARKAFDEALLRGTRNVSLSVIIIIVVMVIIQLICKCKN